MSWTPTHMQNFITIPLPLSPMRKCASSDSARFLVFLPAYSQDPCTDLSAHVNSDHVSNHSRKDVPFGISKTKFYISTPFPSKNGNILNQFSTAPPKFRLKNALTTGMLPCKLPLIVIVAQRKLYSE